MHASPRGGPPPPRAGIPRTEGGGVLRGARRAPLPGTRARRGRGAAPTRSGDYLEGRAGVALAGRPRPPLGGLRALGDVAAYVFGDRFPVHGSFLRAAAVAARTRCPATLRFLQQAAEGVVGQRDLDAVRSPWGTGEHGGAEVPRLGVAAGNLAVAVGDLDAVDLAPGHDVGLLAQTPRL